MRLTEHIHLLKIDFEITLSPDKKLPRFVNVILIFGDKITLIDSGVKGSEDLINDYIRQNNRNFAEIDTLILSHSHPDHIGSAARIKELTGCRILAHEPEKEWIENIEIQNKQRPVPGFFNLVDRSAIIDEYISNGQELMIGEVTTLKFIHSPGHSKGSLNILFKEDKILFTADSIPLKNDIPNYDNFIDLMRSLDAIKKNQDYKILLSSWTPPVTDKLEIDRLLDDGYDYLKKIDSIVKDCYHNEKPETLDLCKIALEKLALPSFLATPLVDNAFKSHFKNFMNNKIFTAKRCFLHAEQQLISAPDKVFPLLCPTREYDWIETWQCDLIFSDSGFAEPDCVFKTNFPGEMEEIWITDRIEPDQIIQFIRVSGQRVIRYCISLTDNGDGSTTARWEQVITALNEEGNLYVENCSNHEFEQRIKNLEMKLNHYLNTGEMYRTCQ